jgi:hypothetical protein
LREPGNETRKTNIEADIVACGQFEHNGNWWCCGTASRLHTLATGYSKLSFFHHPTVCKVSVGNFTWIWNILIHGALRLARWILVQFGKHTRLCCFPNCTQETKLNQIKLNR